MFLGNTRKDVIANGSFPADMPMLPDAQVEVSPRKGVRAGDRHICSLLDFMFYKRTITHTRMSATRVGGLTVSLSPMRAHGAALLA